VGYLLFLKLDLKLGCLPDQKTWIKLSWKRKKEDFNQLKELKYQALEHTSIDSLEMLT
jgi:hypothetical protein